LFTKNGKALTAKGVKPICPFQQIFQSLYLFGAFSPITGDSLLLEMPYCNADTFQLFLNELANKKPSEYKIVVLDNGAFHHAKRLKIPQNITLLFLPPYSPELNPAENMWAKYKRTFTNRLHKSLAELSKFIEEVTRQTTTGSVISTCSFSYVFDGTFWTK
jgi:transposase